MGVVLSSNSCPPVNCGCSRWFYHLPHLNDHHTKFCAFVQKCFMIFLLIDCTIMYVHYHLPLVDTAITLLRTRSDPHCKDAYCSLEVTVSIEVKFREYFVDDP